VITCNYIHLHFSSMFTFNCMRPWSCYKDMLALIQMSLIIIIIILLNDTNSNSKYLLWTNILFEVLKLITILITELFCHFINVVFFHLIVGSQNEC
jgi:hypothetical protein